VNLCIETVIYQSHVSYVITIVLPEREKEDSSEEVKTTTLYNAAERLVKICPVLHLGDVYQNGRSK
jgi:hypothetical protein